MHRGSRADLQSEAKTSLCSNFWLLGSQGTAHQTDGVSLSDSCLTGKPKNISAVYQNNTQVPSPSNSLEQGHPKFFRGSTKIKCPPSLLSVLKEKAYIKKKKWEKRQGGWWAFIAYPFITAQPLTQRFLIKITLSKVYFWVLSVQPLWVRLHRRVTFSSWQK